LRTVIKTYSIRLIGGEEGERAEFAFDVEGRACVLVCRYRGGSISSQEADFFEALVSIRRHLQAEGLMPYCYGASLNVYPSGMARDMGSALQAYRMTIGRHVGIADLVDIFDEGPDVVPSDVEAQEQFVRNWISSPRS
jgi:hypothetical protein